MCGKVWRKEKKKEYETPHYFPGSRHDGKEDRRMRSIRVPGNVPKADVAEGVAGPRAWGGTSGDDKPAPSEPEVEPGSLDVRNEVEPGSGAG